MIVITGCDLMCWIIDLMSLSKISILLRYSFKDNVQTSCPVAHTVIVNKIWAVQSQVLH